MPRKAKELSALEVKRLQYKGNQHNTLYFVGGVSGLALQVSKTGAKSWILRVKIGEKRRDIGLGGYPDVPLAQARQIARDQKELIASGNDPVETRKRQKAELAAVQRRGLTFEKAIELYMDIKEQELSNPKHKAQWTSTLRTYAVPHIGSLYVHEITTQDILRVLQPIWQEKTETASRLRGRIEAVLSWATVSGRRSGENPARWKGNLKELLPAPNKLAQKRNWPAVAVDEVADWFDCLKSQPGIAARALEFAVLCASRSGEVRFATWDELDLKSGIWTVPAQRTKMKRKHRVPLSQAAVALVESLPKQLSSPFLFAGPRGKVLSDMSISGVMRRMHARSTETGGEGWLDPQSKRPAVPHGLRSTFRNWAAETGYPWEMAEIALAHKVGTEVERAYMRTDLLERRRHMISDWALHLSGLRAGNVIPITICEN
ncbi:DUF4102 domain-containing protein [Rhodobacteraceae bacterium RKSG542]|uniref:tyrosine-type recombinase/integrase n=1 Tax=Pseudovibrio flavus TaxID=2529854 RepID=UPI0012BCCD94|nr:integrase arm-type DNA-binding domain-containing protein [Pseudovibrio flavus]MTI17469.1 DUF4102 domain-containing protein [Pseudovibrio flavus]